MWFPVLISVLISTQTFFLYKHYKVVEETIDEIWNELHDLRGEIDEIRKGVKI